MAKRKKTRDALELIRRDVGDNPALWRMIGEEELNVRVAELILQAREAASLTQRGLADRVGTTQPVIARLENADYRGHSLTMLRRIAEALGSDLDLRFVPRRSRKNRAASR